MCGVLPAASPYLALVWTVLVQDLGAEAVGLIAGLFCSPSLASSYSPTMLLLLSLSWSYQEDDGWSPLAHVSWKAQPESTARAWGSQILKASCWDQCKEHPATAPLSRGPTNDQFIAGNQFVASASPLLLCILRAGAFLCGSGQGLGVPRSLWGLARPGMDTREDVPVVVPSQAGVRTRMLGEQRRKAQAQLWALPLLLALGSGEAQGILPSIDGGKRPRF